MQPVATSNILRPFTVQDIDAVAHHANDPDLAANCGPHFPVPYTREHAAAFVTEKAGLTAPFTQLAICRPSDHVLVGTIGIVSSGLNDRCQPYATLGYWVGREAAGQGYASQALAAYTAYAFANWPHLHRLEAYVFEHNLASQRVLEKAGFVHEARLPAHGHYKGKPVADFLFARYR